MEFNTEQFYDNKPEISPMELAQRNMKYLPWILLSLFLSVVAAVLYLRYTPDLYSANGQMIIREDSQGNSGDDKFNRLFFVDAGPNLTNEMAVLKSTSFLQRVVQKMHLNTVYEGVGKVRSALLYEDNPLLLEVLGKKDSVSYSLGISIIDTLSFKLNNNDTIHFGEAFTYGQQGVFRLSLRKKVINQFETFEYKINVYPLDIATERLIPSLDINMTTDKGKIIELSFESMNKQLAADFVNEVMNEYRLLTVEDKSSIATSTMEFIESRLDSLKLELSGVEGAIQQFQEKNETFSPGEQASVYSTMIRDLETKIASIQSKKQILRWLRDYLADTNNLNSVVPVNLGVDEPVLTPLIAAYNDLQLKRATLLKSTTSLNPMVIDLTASIEKLKTDILEALKNVANSYEISLSELGRDYSISKRKAVGIPGQARQLLNIERQQKIKEELYLFLLSKKEEVAIGSAAVVPSASILERATIRAKLVSPIPRAVFIKFILVGLAIPIMVLLAVNMFNDKVRYRGDIEKVVDIPIVGEVSRAEGGAALVATFNSRSYITEQFRTIRTNMSFMLPNLKSPVLMVTSSTSGEGKSFLSTNIAAAFALAGKKTLILEFDIRKPKIASTLGFSFHTGITSFLITKESADSLVLKVKEMENLYLLPCGAIPPNPAELMLLPRMNDLFEWARSNFDVIIIDSAPVGVVSDSISLSKFADATIFVVRQGHTVKKSLEYLADLKEDKMLPNLSIVLNDVTEGASYGYGYGHKKNLEVYFNVDRKKKSGFWNRFLGRS